MRAPQRGRDAFEFRPGGAACLGAVDAAAGAQQHPLRLVRIDVNREHVRVVDHALVDRLPAFAFVGRLPGQMRRAGVDALPVGRRESHGSHDAHLVQPGFGDPPPPSSTVFAEPDPLSGSGCEHLGISRPRRESMHGRAGQVGWLGPGPALIMSGPEPGEGRTVVVDAHQVVPGVSRIEQQSGDRSEEMPGEGQADPSLSAVRRAVHEGVASARQQHPRIRRVHGDRGRSATPRTRGDPALRGVLRFAGKLGGRCKRHT